MHKVSINYVHARVYLRGSLAQPTADPHSFSWWWRTGASLPSITESSETDFPSSSSVFFFFFFCLVLVVRRSEIVFLHQIWTFPKARILRGVAQVSSQKSEVNRARNLKVEHPPPHTRWTRRLAQRFSAPRLYLQPFFPPF